MKLKDLLTAETWNEYGDMDVANDVTDELWPAWCGETLTDEGRERFKEALELEAIIRPVWGYQGIYLLLDDDPDWEKHWNMAGELFESMCGYCTEEEWNRWFQSI